MREYDDIITELSCIADAQCFREVENDSPDHVDILDLFVDLLLLGIKKAPVVLKNQSKRPGLI